MLWHFANASTASEITLLTSESLEEARGHNNFHDEMKVSVFMDDIWDFIAMINNSLHFRFSIIAMKKEIILSVLPFMSMIILFKHDPQSLIAMNRII